MYHKKKSKHKNFRNQKKAAVQQLLDEIEGLISQLSTSAQNANMLCIDLENGESMIDDERINERIQKEIELDEKRENDEKIAYEKKKEEIMNDASEQDKAKFRNALASIQNDINSFDKEMNKGEEDEGEAEN